MEKAKDLIRMTDGQEFLDIPRRHLDAVKDSYPWSTAEL